MRRYIYLTLALLFSTTIFAQEIINETFESSEMPEGWTVSGTSTANWSISTTNNAGGKANEAKLTWYPQFAGTTRLVAAPVNLSEIESVYITFNHYLDNFNGSSTLGVATSSDNGETWNIGWKNEYDVTGKYSVEEKIATTDMGKDNVLFCIFFDGSSARFQNWYFDNIVVKAQSNSEIRLNSINIYDRVGSGPLNVNFQVQNMGSDEITSFEASYEIDGFDIVTETFSTSLASFGVENYSFTTKKSIMPGTYEITINIISVNGGEDNQQDNTLSKGFNASLSEKQRMPMIEHFSSSTCAPCVLLNSLMLKLTENNPGKYTYTKYVVNYPGVGDPYYTEESGIRKNYYEAHSVPRIFLDSELQLSGNTAQPVTQNALMQRYNEPAFADIRGAFDIDENGIITITADVASYVNLNDVRTFISVNEKTTTENTVEYGGNGETEFHHVMLKMMDEGNGIATTINAGEYKRFEFTYDMTTTFMEEADDLEVAVWVQDLQTKEIFNSHYLYEYTEHPYPVQDLQFTFGNRLKITWNAPEKGTPTGYNLYLDNTLVLSNTKETSFSIDMTDFCIAEVEALYENGKTSIGVMNIYSSEYEAPANLEVTANTNDIALKWDAVENAIGYQVYRNGTLLSDVIENNYTDKNVKKGQEYCYQVKAIFNEGKSALTKESCETALGDGTESITEYRNKLSIYPNPANNHLYIETDDIIKNINIYNMIGMSVYRNGNVSDNYICIENLDSGVYIMEISTENEVVIKQFIKQ